MAIRLDNSQPAIPSTALRRKASLVQVAEWTEGQGFQVAIRHGAGQRSGPLWLSF
jgi:hypothetical protein